MATNEEKKEAFRKKILTGSVTVKSPLGDITIRFSEVASKNNLLLVFDDLYFSIEVTVVTAKDIIKEARDGSYRILFAHHPLLKAIVQAQNNLSIDCFRSCNCLHRIPFNHAVSIVQTFGGGVSDILISYLNYWNYATAGNGNELISLISALKHDWQRLQSASLSRLNPIFVELGRLSKETFINLYALQPALFDPPEFREYFRSQVRIPEKDFGGADSEEERRRAAEEERRAYEEEERRKQEEEDRRRGEEAARRARETREREQREEAERREREQERQRADREEQRLRDEERRNTHGAEERARNTAVTTWFYDHPHYMADIQSRMGHAPRNVISQVTTEFLLLHMDRIRIESLLDHRTLDEPAKGGVKGETVRDKLQIYLLIIQDYQIVLTEIEQIYQLPFEQRPRSLNTFADVSRMSLQGSQINQLWKRLARVGQDEFNSKMELLTSMIRRVRESDIIEPALKLLDGLEPDFYKPLEH